MKLTRIHSVDIIKSNPAQQRNNPMVTGLTVHIRIIEFGKLPSERNSSASFDFCCGCFCHRFRGQEGEFSQAFLVAAWGSYPDLFGVGEVIEGGVEGVVFLAHGGDRGEGGEGGRYRLR